MTQRRITGVVHTITADTVLDLKREGTKDTTFSEENDCSS